MEYDASNAVWVDKSTGTTYDPMSGAWTDKKGSVYDPKTKTWQQTLLSKIAGFPDWLNANADKSGDWGLLGQGVSALQHMIMGAIAGQESKGMGDTNAVNKDSGALGRYQFMPATADEYLGTSWTKKYGSTTTAAGRANFLGSPAAQERAALAYLMDLEKVAAAKHFKGPDFIRAIAEGWYGGPGAVGNPNVSGGAGYPTTGQYSTKVLERLLKALIQKQQHGTKVSISNSTSARVAVSANAIATG